MKFMCLMWLMHVSTTHKRMLIWDLHLGHMTKFPELGVSFAFHQRVVEKIQGDGYEYLFLSEYKEIKAPEVA